MYSIFNKKLLALVLAVAMTVCAFSGCADLLGDVTEDTDTETEEDTVDTSEDTSKDTSKPDDSGEKVVIASDGESDFTIWVANDIFSGYADIVSQINDMASLIRNKTGAVIDVMSDSSYSVRASKNAGILIGNTVFAESSAVGREMKNNDYCVELSGNKIVLYGGDVDGVAKAVRYFYITVLNSQKVVDKTMVFDPAVHTLYETSKYDINSIKCAEAELGGFNIVLPAEPTVNESYFAYSLRYWLYQKYGYRMSIVDDTSVESEHEVLIGNTGRTDTADVADGEYSISVSDGKLCLVAGGMLSYNEMYDYVTKTLFKAGGSADYSLPEDYSHRESITTDISDGSVLTEAKTGDVRVMYYNVFSNIETYEDGTTTGPIPLRQSLQTELIRAYAPDIVGFQEFSANYEPFVYCMTDLGYEQVPSNANVVNQNPLFFNSNTLELVASGYHGYTGIDRQKAVSWAVFKVRETGKSFIAMSTHFMWNSPALTEEKENDALIEEKANEARELNATELLALISDLRAQGYGELPIIVGGDFNCHTDSTALQKLIGSELGFTCAQSAAEQKNDTNGHHSYSRYDTKFETYSTVYGPNTNKTHTDAIDHAFVTSGMTVNSFASITNLYTLLASDHCPTVTDITVN